MRLASVIAIATAVGCGSSSSKAGGTQEMAPEDNEDNEAPQAATPKAPEAAALKPTAPSGSSGKQASATIDGVEIAWSLSRRGDSLVADVTITNGTTGRVYVCDQLLAPDRTGRRYQPLDRLTVQNIEDVDSRIRLVVGTPATDVPSAEIPPTTWRAIEPGARHSFTRTTPWPLESFNVMGMTNPLSAKASEAVLIVHSFRGEPGYWRDVQTIDGATLKVPEMFTPTDLTAPALPLPR